MVVNEDLLGNLTAVVSTGLAADLPLEVEPHLCGDRLVPPCKKDPGVRPHIVNEFL